MSTLNYKTNKEVSKMDLNTRIKYERVKREYEYLKKTPLPTGDVDRVYRNHSIVNIALKAERTFEGRKVYHLYDGRFKAQVYEPEKVNDLKVRSMSDAKERLSKSEYKKMMKSFSKRKNKIGKIFIGTHVARYDIETIKEIAGVGTYLLVGDMNESYKNFDGFFLNFSGLIALDTAYKLDRQASLAKCVQILLNGGNIVLYPEGAWNITKDEIVMKLFNGAAIMAKTVGTDVIPIAIEARKNKYYTAVGAPISISKDDKRTYREISDDFRDKMTELKVTKILDKIPLIKRSELPDDAYTYMKDEVMSETENGYTEEEIERTRYHDKEKEEYDRQNSYDAVYEPIKKLKLNKNNAFLLNDRQNGRRIV